MRKQYRSEYYEAIIQIRPLREEINEFVMRQILARNDVFVSKKVAHETGVDFYVSSQKFARSLGNQIKRHFGGKLTLSYTLHTRDRQTSRDVHRATVLFRAE